MKINLNMNPSQRLHHLLVAAIVLALAGLGAGAYGANSLLVSRSNKLMQLKAKDQALAQEQISLVEAKKEIKTYSDLQKITQAVVPEDKDQAEAVREIVNIAAANGVALSSITFPASTLGAGIAGATTTSGAPAQATPAGGSGSSSSKTGKLSQLTPVKNIPGVYNLLITVQSDSSKPVPYNSFVSFLSALEHNRRTAQLSTITLQPKTSDRNLLTFTLTLHEYIKP